MASVTDIRLGISLQTHRKTKKLIKRLGPQGFVSLIFLWMQAAANNPNGRLGNMDIEDICVAAEWDGDEEEFITALLDMGWLDKSDSGEFVIHDWEDHQPYVVTAKQRSAKAKKAAKARWDNENSDSEESEVMPVACSEHARSNAKSDFSNAPSPSPSPSPYPYPNPEEGFPKLVQPMANGGSYTVTPEDLKNWQERFSYIDIIDVIKAAITWYSRPENKKKLPPKSGWKALDNWLRRDNEKAKARSPSTTTPTRRMGLDDPEGEKLAQAISAHKRKLKAQREAARQ